MLRQKSNRKLSTYTRGCFLIHNKEIKMIFNKSTIYAYIWKVTRPKDDKGNPRNYLELQISTSEKSRDDNTTAFSVWFPRVIGHAFNNLKGLAEGKYEKAIPLTITQSKFTNEKYEAKDGTTKSAFKFIILEATLDNKQKEEPKEEPKEEAKEEPKADGSCPW